MDSARWNIDEIVREVIRRLQPAPPQAIDPPPPPAAGSAAGSEPAGGRDELHLAQRVVSLAALDGRLAGVRRLVVQPAAVVTPSVRDLLRRQGVALVRAALAPASAPRGVRLLVAAEADCDPAQLAGQLGGECLQARSLPAGLGQLAAQLGEPATLGVLLTHHAFAALCLANRHRCIRAVSADSPAAVGQAVRAVGANLLVLDPAACGEHTLADLVRTFTAEGPRSCPPPLREALENG